MSTLVGIHATSPAAIEQVAQRFRDGELARFLDEQRAPVPLSNLDADLLKVAELRDAAIQLVGVATPHADALRRAIEKLAHNAHWAAVHVAQLEEVVERLDRSPS